MSLEDQIANYRIHFGGEMTAEKGEDVVDKWLDEGSGGKSIQCRTPRLAVNPATAVVIAELGGELPTGQRLAPVGGSAGVPLGRIPKRPGMSRRAHTGRRRPARW
jgi:hypothetical protein